MPPMSRRRRREPLGPLLLVIALGAFGLWVGSLVTGRPGRLADPPGSATRDELAANLRFPTSENRIKVEVLNGSGVPGVAGRATELLRNRGFDVVYFGNESSFARDSSLVLDRTGREGVRAAVSQFLGISLARGEPDGSRLVDITVLLGTDWRPDETLAQSEPDLGGGGAIVETGRSWWDLRRLFEPGK
jgi:hypothetical protein